LPVSTAHYMSPARLMSLAKGEIGSLSNLEVVNMEKTLQQGQETGAFKYDQRLLLLD